MKTALKISLGSAFICLLTACSLPAPAPSPGIQTRDVPFYARNENQEPRKRLIVLPFLDEKPERAIKVAEVARTTVVQELLRTNHFVVVKNEDFPQNLSQFMTKDREYDMEKISRIASSMGVAAVLEGKILDIRARRLGDQIGLIRKLRARVETTVRIRLFATKNSREILHDVREATAETETTRVGQYASSDRFLEEDPTLVREGVVRAFYGALGPIVKAVEKLTWEGRVAMVSGERIYINAGRLSGIQINDILKITEDSEEVFDPETGRFIGTAPGRMKGTVEVTSYFGRDGAIAVIHSGSGFRENDRVELY
ncbi:MAG: hypothetical protein H6624_04845 [Bdellovibrionaceae bacterium]|nr:hypothetical protein [Bdellovibrionales bacterium]MCB9083645.1 hypothetical protein [Pseudobdellovibrionaceae bacterium]